MCVVGRTKKVRSSALMLHKEECTACLLPSSFDISNMHFALSCPFSLSLAPMFSLPRHPISPPRPVPFLLSFLSVERIILRSFAPFSLSLSCPLAPARCSDQEQCPHRPLLLFPTPLRQASRGLSSEVMPLGNHIIRQVARVGRQPQACEVPLPRVRHHHHAILV